MTEQHKPTLAVGQTWWRRDGRLVTIDRIDTTHAWGDTHPFIAQGHSYTPNGIFNEDFSDSAEDLMELIYPAVKEIYIEEPTPTFTPRLFRSIIKCDDWEYAVATDGTAWRRQVFAGDNGGPWNATATPWGQITPLPAGEGES